MCDGRGQDARNPPLPCGRGSVRGAIVVKPYSEPRPQGSGAIADGLRDVGSICPVVLYSIVPHRILGVIPARYASSRFPGKVLVSIAGKTMLQHVWERASQARYLTDLVIATDDERIRAAAEQFRARVVMTRGDHPSGTDRAAEVASASNADLIVNIQGDEPLIDPAAIDTAILGM